MDETDEQIAGNIQTAIWTADDNGFQAKKWFITYHIRLGESFEQAFHRLEPLKDICDKYVWGEEYGKTGKTPHIQGAFILSSKMRANTLQQFFKNGATLRKLKNWDASFKYCRKECNHIETNIPIPRPLALMERRYLRDDQLEIIDLFKDWEDPLWGRKIYWFWEPQGAWGKTTVCLHLVDFCGGYVIQGANKDCLNAMNNYLEAHNGEGPKIVIFDIPRCNEGAFSAQAVESIKSGCIFNSKYESGMRRFNRPHVVIFSNQEPEKSKLSKDRWIIKRL